MNLEEYKAHVLATRKASVEQAVALMSEANATLSTMFNLNESESN